MRPPLSPDFIRNQRYNPRNLETTAAGSPTFTVVTEAPDINVIIFNLFTLWRLIKGRNHHGRSEY
ncbi:hypothetical protein J2T20_000664 [Paenibacillus wynnii]|nr:hypothetical protein [Paenibacillus wynnii]